MLTIKRTDQFNDWLNGIRDGMTQRRLVKRYVRLRWAI